MPGFGKLDWDNWLYGLFYALISGGSGSVSSGFANMLVDPKDFNTAHPARILETMMVTFIVAGALGFFGFLKQQPLPAIVQKTTVETTEVHVSPAAKVVTTVEKTEVIPPKEDK